MNSSVAKKGAPKTVLNHKAPRFTVKVYTPAACRCCGMQLNPDQKAQAFITIDAALTAYIEKVGKPAYLREAKRQCAAAMQAYDAAKAKEPETGDAAILRLLKAARALYTAGSRIANAAPTNDWSSAEAKWEKGRECIRAAVATKATSIAGIAAKVTFATSSPDAFHGGYGQEEMGASAHRDMQAVLRRAGSL